jgi:Flp pilus assembly protein TadG
MRSIHPTRADDGSVVLIVAVVMTICLMTAVGIGRVGEVVASRARAQTAADAAALAGLTSGRPGAARVAQANGAVLVSYVRSGWTVTVQTRVEEVTARARASNGP